MIRDLLKATHQVIYRMHFPNDLSNHHTIYWMHQIMFECINFFPNVSNSLSNASVYRMYQIASNTAIDFDLPYQPCQKFICFISIGCMVARQNLYTAKCYNSCYIMSMRDVSGLNPYTKRQSDLNRIHWLGWQILNAEQHFRFSHSSSVNLNWEAQKTFTWCHAWQHWCWRHLPSNHCQNTYTTPTWEEHMQK